MDALTKLVADLVELAKLIAQADDNGPDWVVNESIDKAKEILERIEKC